MMKKQKGFATITIIIALAVFTLLVGGTVVLQKQFLSQKSQQPTPTPYSALSPTPTSMLTPQPTAPPTTISCRTDADCPPIACVQGCPVEGPCPPCPQNKCLNGNCQPVYPNYSESLGKKIQLVPGQTVSLAAANLSLTLLQIIPAPEGSFDYPTKAELEVRSGGRSEKISFIAGVLATKEAEAKLRVKEAFGFRIIRESLNSEGIVFTVQRL